MTPRTDCRSESGFCSEFYRQKERITLSAVTPFYGLLINLIRISACPFSVNSCRYRRRPIIFKDKHLRASVVRRTFQNNLLFARQDLVHCVSHSSVHHSLFHSVHSKSSASVEEKCVHESERVRRAKERMVKIEKIRRKKKRWETRI